MPPRRPAVLFLDAANTPSGVTFQHGVPPLLEQDWDVYAYTRQDTDEDKLMRWAPLVDAIVSASHAGPSGELLWRVLSKASRCRLYQIPFTGTDHVDWGRVPPSVTVCNAFGMESGIAEFVIAAVLGWSTGLWQGDAEVRRRQGAVQWPFRPPTSPPHKEARGRTLGIVGFGHIGQAVAQLAVALGMRVVGVRRNGAPAPPGVDWVRAASSGLADLLRQSDFVVLCCDLNKATQGLLGEAQLGLMKRDAVLINVARGPVVDERALYEACRDGRIGGAVIDVWWNYGTQKSQPAPSRFPFWQLPNVVLSQHCSGWTDRMADRRFKIVANNLDRLAQGKPLEHVVHRPPPSSKL